LPKDQVAKLAAIGAAVSGPSLSRLWQMLLKAYDEVRRSPDPSAAVEMALIRLCYAADLPGPEEALKAMREGGDPTGGQGGGPPAPPGGGSGGGGSTGRGGASPRMAVQTAPAISQEIVLQSFDDVVALIDKRRDIALRLDVQKFVRLISFRVGAISFEPAPGAPNNLSQRLSVRLKEWTGQPWLVAAETGGGAETLAERQTKEDEAIRAEALADPFVQSVMQVFPGAELTEIRQIAPPEPAAAPAEDDAEDEEDE
jgi:DNA polymerase-3 subunit gamma/tau